MTADAPSSNAAGPLDAEWTAPAHVEPVHRELSTTVRIASGGMLAIAAAWPWLPHPPSVCPMLNATGVPCPLCGMTRSVAAAVHGHFVTSLRFNPAGIVVVLLAIVLLFRPQLARLKPPLWIPIVALGALWVWNIGPNPTF